MQANDAGNLVARALPYSAAWRERETGAESERSQTTTLMTLAVIPIIFYPFSVKSFLLNWCLVTQRGQFLSPVPFVRSLYRKRKEKKAYELDFLFRLWDLKKKPRGCPSARVPKPKRVEHYFLVRPMKASFAANKKGENSDGTCQILWIELPLFVAKVYHSMRILKDQLWRKLFRNLPLWHSVILGIQSKKKVDSKINELNLIIRPLLIRNCYR